jgi:hypothetical protein
MKWASEPTATKHGSERETHGSSGRLVVKVELALEGHCTVLIG